MKSIYFLCLFFLFQSCKSSQDILAEKSTEFGAITAEKCQESFHPAVYKNENQVLRKLGYPAELRRERVQGAVTFSLIINEKGKIDYAQPKSSPDTRLTNLVRSGLRDLEIEPGTCNGKPVTVLQELTMRFRVAS